MGNGEEVGELDLILLMRELLWIKLFLAGLAVREAQQANTQSYFYLDVIFFVTSYSFRRKNSQIELRNVNSRGLGMMVRGGHPALNC